MVATLFLLFAAFSAFVEAVLYARRGAESFTFNEHAVMVLQRAAAVLLPFAGIWVYHISGAVWYVASEALYGLLAFPLVHDEAYNFTRLWLTESQKTSLVWGINPPVWLMQILPSGPDGRAFCRAFTTYRYGYQSPTTTARNDFNGRQRTWLASLGVVAWATAAYFLL